MSPICCARLILIVLAFACAAGSTGLAAQFDEPIQPIPHASTKNPAKIALGQRLFNDSILSANNSVSCASCHVVAKGGADGKAHSPGFKGQPTQVNTPTVLNAALNFRQFWNGRADTLEAQIAKVVENPIEMGSTWGDVVRKLSGNASYAAAFAAAYQDGVTKANVADAIATYERTLVTPNSRFDRFLRGESKAISAEELSGYTKFKKYGCVACHQGVNVGGNMYQKFGVMGDYFAQRGKPTEADLGRYLVTGDPQDKYVFKVPGLRNVALTAPYFHDGSAKTLEDAVDVMFRYQLGRVASRRDKQEIIKFLGTLTGEDGAAP